MGFPIAPGQLFPELAGRQEREARLDEIEEATRDYLSSPPGSPERRLKAQRLLAIGAPIPTEVGPVTKPVVPPAPKEHRPDPLVSAVDTAKTEPDQPEPPPTNRIVATKDPTTGKITFVTENLAGGLDQVDYNSAIQELTGRDPRTAGNAFIVGGGSPASFSDQLETMPRPELSGPATQESTPSQFQGTFAHNTSSTFSPSGVEAAADRQQWINQRVAEERYLEAMGDQARLGRAQAAQAMQAAQVDPIAAEQARLAYEGARTRLLGEQARVEAENVGLVGAQTRRERAAGKLLEDPVEAARLKGKGAAVELDAREAQWQEQAQLMSETPNGQRIINGMVQELQKSRPGVPVAQLKDMATFLYIESEVTRKKKEAEAPAYLRAGFDPNAR